MNKELQLFDDIFARPWREGTHNLCFRPQCIANPTYRHWQDFVQQYRITYAEVPTAQLKPQIPSATQAFGQSVDSVLAQPTYGTGLLRALADNVNNPEYARIYQRVREFINVAYDIVPENSVWNRPVITLYKEKADIHPGNRLVTAHQILGRPVRALVCSKRSITPDYEFEYGNIILDNIATLEQIRTVYRGKITAFWECNDIPTSVIDYSKVHMWSGPDYWDLLDDKGYPAYSQKYMIDFILFLRATLDYEGEEVSFLDLHNKTVKAKILTNQHDIDELFSRTDLYELKR